VGLTLRQSQYRPAELCSVIDHSRNEFVSPVSNREELGCVFIVVCVTIVSEEESRRHE
jgi:hypothetical protein